MKHAPGPWELSQYENYIGYAIYARGHGCISERWYAAKLSEQEDDFMRANARLISKAPEMLELLQKHCHTCKGGLSDSQLQAYCKTCLTGKLISEIEEE
jgi:hypothetical protein